MDSDNNKKPEFVNVFELKNSQFHFKPTKITEITKEYATLEGLEGMSNAKISIRLPTETFSDICFKHPNETRPFLAEYYTNQKNEAESKLNDRE